MRGAARRRGACACEGPGGSVARGGGGILVGGVRRPRADGGRASGRAGGKGSRDRRHRAGPPRRRLTQGPVRLRRGGRRRRPAPGGGTDQALLVPRTHDARAGIGLAPDRAPAAAPRMAQSGRLRLRRLAVREPDRRHRLRQVRSAHRLGARVVDGPGARGARRPRPLDSLRARRLRQRGADPRPRHRRSQRGLRAPLADVAGDRHRPPHGDLGPAHRDGGGRRVLGCPARMDAAAARRAARRRPAGRGGRGDAGRVRLRAARGPLAADATRAADARGARRVAAVEAVHSALVRTRPRAGRGADRRPPRGPGPGLLAVLRGRGGHRDGDRHPADHRPATGGRPAVGGESPHLHRPAAHPRPRADRGHGGAGAGDV